MQLRRPAWRSRCRLVCTSASSTSTANSGDDSAAWAFRSASRADASHCVAPARLGSAGRTGGSRLEVQREAAPLYALSQNADDPAELWERALLFDASLKQRRLNPGATADLTVATLFVRRLRDLGLPNFPPDVLQSQRNND